jgi:hypothetical protein
VVGLTPGVASHRCDAEEQCDAHEYNCNGGPIHDYERRAHTFTSLVLERPPGRARDHFGVTGIRTESLPLAVSVSGKRDFGAREKCAETASSRNSVVSEERTVAPIPANSGPFVHLQEISGSTRLRGGAGSQARSLENSLFFPLLQGILGPETTQVGRDVPERFVRSLPRLQVPAQA